MLGHAEIKQDSLPLMFGSKGVIEDSAGSERRGQLFSSPQLQHEEFHETFSRKATLNEAPSPTQSSSSETGPGLTRSSDCEQALQQLQTADQLRLLNAIDRLRSGELRSKIHIPQIVVCGNQSSGKSAVLEAISHLPFPSGASTTTRFATELILRKSSRTSVSATIEPPMNSTPAFREASRAFQPLTSCSLDDFASLHRQAQDFFQEHSPGRFCFARLKIEVAGPDQPHLTLVDLPGLISVTTGKTNSADVRGIEDLVRSYIKSPRAIVLAVFAANYDFDNQSIANLIGEDPAVQSRTLGVLTYLDAPMTSDRKANNIDLAYNNKIQTGLGWHLMCNLDHEATDRSIAARKLHEKEHLDKQPWNTIDGDHKGIEALQRRLAAALYSNIRTELPGLRSDIQKQLIRHEQTLNRLGPERKDAVDHRSHLNRIAETLDSVLQAGIYGSYGRQPADKKDELLAIINFFQAKDARRLRMWMNHEQLRFATHLNSSWRYVLVMKRKADASAGSDPTQQQRSARDEGQTAKYGPERSKHKVKPVSFSSSNDNATMERIEIDDFLRDLLRHTSDSRGTLLPGIGPDHIVADIIKLQCVHWKGVCRHHLEICYGKVHEFVYDALHWAAGQHTGSILWEEIIAPMLEQRRKELHSKLDEVLWPHLTSHPDTSRHMDLSKMPTWIERGEEPKCTTDDIKKAVARIAHAAWYTEVARETLNDNVMILVIERCLLWGLSGLLSSHAISSMGDETLARLARTSETEDDERRVAEAEKEILQEVIRDCR